MTESNQGILLACYYWGYTANQVLAGYLAYRFGHGFHYNRLYTILDYTRLEPLIRFKIVLGCGIGAGAILTGTFPMVYRVLGFKAAVISRILLGFCHVSN